MSRIGSSAKRFGMRSRTIANSFRTPLFRIRCVDEIEIASFDRRQIGHQAVVDPVRINDDPALGGLPEDLGQAHDRH